YIVNLDASVAAFGLAYNSTFRIRFNQYDNYPIQASNSDGIGLDDISVTGGLAGVLDHFNVSTVATPQLVNAPFQVTITAVDAGNSPVSSFTGAVNLWGVPGLITVSPATTGNFVNGSWTGSLTVAQALASVRLHTDDGSGHAGEGNNFTILATNDLALTAS